MRQTKKEQVESLNVEIVALMLKRNLEGLENQAVAEGKRKCPYCAEMIQAEAKVCRYCGRDVAHPVD